MTPSIRRPFSGEALLLIQRAEKLASDENVVVAELLEVLIAIEDKKVLDGHYASMHDFCVAHLRMSEGSAYRRTNAAKLAKRFPALLQMVAAGDVTLSALVALRPHLREDNFRELIEKTRGMTKRALEDYLRERFESGGGARPARPGRVRKLPTLQTGTVIAYEGGPAPVVEKRHMLKAPIEEKTSEQLRWLIEVMEQMQPSRDVTRILGEAIEDYVAKVEAQLAAAGIDIDAKEAAAEVPPAEVVLSEVPSAEVPSTEAPTAEKPAAPAADPQRPKKTVEWPLAKTSGKPRACPDAGVCAPGLRWTRLGAGAPALAGEDGLRRASGASRGAGASSRSPRPSRAPSPPTRSRD